MPDSARPASPGTRRAFEDICERVRRQIAAGELKAGDKLPAEREMAERFGVGRNAVREALRSLEMAGIVRLQKGRSGGAFIRPVNPSRVTHAMRDLIDYGSIGWADLTEARTLVLDTVVRLACERADDADFDALERNVDETDELTRAGHYAARTEVSYDFYQLLAAATRNNALVMLVTSMSDLVRRLVRTRELYGKRPMENLVASRRRLLRSLRDRDGDAAVAELRAFLIRVHKLMEDDAPKAQAPARGRGAKRPAPRVSGEAPARPR